MFNARSAKALIVNMIAFHRAPLNCVYAILAIFAIHFSILQECFHIWLANEKSLQDFPNEYCAVL